MIPTIKKYGCRKHYLGLEIRHKILFLLIVLFLINWGFVVYDNEIKMKEEYENCKEDIGSNCSDYSNSDKIIKLGKWKQY